jgi:dipeptidase E
MSKRVLLVSTSTIHGGSYLDYILPDVKKFFEGKKNLIFIPYAQPGGISYDAYSEKAKAAFELVGLSIRGIHEWKIPAEAVESCDGIFTGGGNTFLLLQTLQEHVLLDAIRKKVSAGTPYMGTSAGSNIAGLTINNTNDMPIVYPYSFDALGLVPFNVNPHYLDPDPSSKHMGETRETRINEFHQQSSIPVLGIREGSALLVMDQTWSILGTQSIRLFRQKQEAKEVKDADTLRSFLEAN